MKLELDKTENGVFPVRFTCEMCHKEFPMAERPIECPWCGTFRQEFHDFITAG